MTDADFAETARKAFAELPEGTSHGDTPEVTNVYFPPSHVKALDANCMLVTGMRGAGKTFWWTALQKSGVRELVDQHRGRFRFDERADVRAGFGVTPAPDRYPSKDVLRNLMSAGVEPRSIWRTVQAGLAAPAEHSLMQLSSWSERVDKVGSDPEAIERLFHQRDAESDRKGVYFLMLFDALDRCSDDWKEMYRLIRGLLQTAVEMRAYRRLRVKVFLRTDQVNETEIADFPDASKVLSSAVELSWPRRDLFGLLWHLLVNGKYGDQFRRFLGLRNLSSTEVEGHRVVYLERGFTVNDKYQRKKFHDIAGPFMGTNRRRGFPYTWIPNHLADAAGRVTPRSFLAALRAAAEKTVEEQPNHEYALHHDCIKQGVQEVSRIRVREVREDYPWIDQVMEPLGGMTVPCRFGDISRRWRGENVLDSLTELMAQKDVKLPPAHIRDGAPGIRRDLESLGVFMRLGDGRVNIPDVFRLGYGLGRKGGVRPVR